jgi:hypothetical protein
VNPAEAALADDVYDAVMTASRYSPRGQQSMRFEAGISDLGYCSERLRRMLDQQTPDDTDLLPAWMGQVLGGGLEEACLARWPDAVAQAEVTCTLRGESGNVYKVRGHPDLLRPGLVIDFKSDRGLHTVRRTGPSQQQQFQRHCYALGAWETGLFGPIDLADIQVANVWIDRAADERELHVQMEPYDPKVVEAAAWWLDDVVYAYVNQQEARKEPPREVCAVTCGFYATCRALDTDVEGLLTDDDAPTAVRMYREGLDMEKAGAQLKDQARAHLRGIQGSTGEYTVRWVHVNGSHVEFDRDSYERLDIKQVK